MNQIQAIIDEFTSNETAALNHWKADGNKVMALFCRFFPPALIAGFGFWPVRVTSGATLEAEKSAEALIRPDGCAYCKSIIGNFRDGTGIHRYVDSILGLVTCDQMRHTLERLYYDCGIPVFPVQVPATQTTQSRNYFIQSVDDAVRTMTAFYHREIDPVAIKRFERNRYDCAQKLRTIALTLRPNPLIVHQLFHLFTWARPDSLSSFLDHIEHHLCPFNERYAIVVTGSALCLEDDFLIRYCERQNVYPFMLHCTGITMIEGIVPVDSIPDTTVTAVLADGYGNMPACIRARPNTAVYTRMQTFCKQVHARGIVVKTLSFCDLWYTEKERIRQNFDIPVLILDTGYSTGHHDQLSTRLETFLETIA